MTYQSAIVLDPAAPIGHHSQAKLGDQWWQYVDRIPYEKHFGAYDDATDPRGMRGSLEKALSYQPHLSGAPQDHVLFIGGAFGNLLTTVGETMIINRSIILPNATTTVFFPLLNATANNLARIVNPETGELDYGGRDNVGLQADVATFMNKLEDNQNQLGVSALFAVVDGTIVQNPSQYRQASSDENGFNIYPIQGGMTELALGYPPDATYLADPDRKGMVPGNPNGYPTISALGGYNAPDAYTLGIQTFADGYWLGVELTPGAHTLHFGGTYSMVNAATQSIETAFGLDITYNILNPVHGSRWRDRLDGTQGNDYMDGGKGDDRLFGCDGDDLLVGGKGNDILSGGTGADELWGDEGYDTFIFRRGFGADMVYDFSQGDRIDIRGLCWSHGSISPSDLNNGLSATEIKFGGGDVLTLVNINPDQLRIHDGFITLQQVWHC